MSDMTKSATFEVTLDFEKMMEQVLEKHWGYWGDRPESFEEYCCMLVAQQLSEHVRMNEFRTSDVIKAVKAYLDAEGKEIAERVAKGATEQSRQFAYGEDFKGMTPAEYFERALRIQLDARAHHKARQIARDNAESEAAQ